MLRQKSLGQACLAVLCAVLFAGADWRAFRGNDGTGVAPGTPPPLSWKDDGENVAWKVALPGRGLSSPIVVGDRVIVTASSGFRQDRLHVLCFEVKTGQKRWERQFWATGRTQTHRTISVATSTPASDGRRVFALFSSNDLACLDLEGNLLWYRGLGHDFPNANNSLGMASSPLVVDDTLVVQVEADAEAFATGLDVETGIGRWRIERPERANWSSPVMLKRPASQDALVLLQSSRGLAAVRPRTGKLVWSYDDGASTTSSSVVGDGTIFVPSHGITALRPIPRSDSTPELLWQKGFLSPRFVSPLYLDGRIYIVGSAGVLTCADAESGQRLWQLRLKGSFSGTPVAVDPYLYLFNKEGLGQTVKIDGERGRVVGGGDLGETIQCTPAISGGALFVRSDGHLWKIAAP